MATADASALDVEEVLERIRGWGRYQKIVYVLACLPSIMSAMVTVGYSWTAFGMDHRCFIPGCEFANNATYIDDFLEWTVPPDPDLTWSRCTMYRRAPGSDPGSCNRTDFWRNETLSCSNHVYDRSVMQDSIVSEFDLVCDRAELPATGNSIFFVAMAVGSILTGIVSDRFGRLVTLVGGVFLTVVLFTAGAFSPNFATYTALRALAAVSSFSFFCIGFVLSMELTSVHMRAFCGIVINMFFAVGEAICGAIPIAVRGWRHLQLVYSIPTVVFLSYWFILPESPRWLVTSGKPEKAEKVLRTVARWNGKPYPETISMPSLGPDRRKAKEVEANPTESSVNMLVAFKSPVLVKRAVISCVQWMVTSMVYYGIGMVSTDLAGDVHVNFILTMLIEIPSYAFVAFTVNPLGRKLLCVIAFSLCGMGTILAGLLSETDVSWLVTVMALVGKFGAAAAFSMMYLYTAELYPTALRTQGVGISACFGRIGSIVAPFVSELGDGTPLVPMCIFGVCGLVAAAITLFLPETSGKELPTTLEEAISFGSDQSWLPVPFLERRRRRTSLHSFDGPAAFTDASS